MAESHQNPVHSGIKGDTEERWKGVGDGCGLPKTQLWCVKITDGPRELVQERKRRQVNASAPAARREEWDSLIIPGRCGDQEWDCVKLSQGKSLGEMEILTSPLRIKHHPDHVPPR